MGKKYALRGFPKHKNFGGGVTSPMFTNKSGSKQTAGTVVIFYPDADQAFTTTTYERDRRVLGVTKAAIANNAAGYVAVGFEVVTVKVTGNVAVGDWLMTSDTEGRAEAAGKHRSPGALGIAQTSFTGTNGEVEAMIIPDHYVAEGDGENFTLTGRAASGSTNIIQKFTKANETISTMTAVMAGSTYGHGSCWNKNIETHGYTLEGANYLERVQKYLYNTDTNTNLYASTAMVNKLNISKQVGGDTYGRMIGGQYSTTWYNEGSIMAWATDSESADAAAISGNRSNLISLQDDGNDNSYVGGGRSASTTEQDEVWKIVNASGVDSLLGGLLSNKRCSGMGNWNVTYGWFVGGYDAGNFSSTEKIEFSSDTISSGSGTMITAVDTCYVGNYETDQVAYMFGGSNGMGSAVTDSIQKQNLATEVFAAVTETIAAASSVGGSNTHIL